jgi:Schlafen, AlbA_2
VPQTSIRRLSLAGLDEGELRRLIDHGEDLFVERKVQPPEGDGLGAAVASLANTLGGWLLLGVGDDRSVQGYEPGERIDPQSHFGQVLSNQVDPLPPFVADVRRLDEKPITVIRVFESMDTPHLLTASGAIYVRDSSGKKPVSDHTELVELARRGEAALERAQKRFRSLVPPIQDLATWDRPDLIAAGTQGVALVVRAAPLTLTPQFSDWGISKQGVEACVPIMQSMAEALVGVSPAIETRPQGRGFVNHWGGPGSESGGVAVDSGGSLVSDTTIQSLQVGESAPVCSDKSCCPP